VAVDTHRVQPGDTLSSLAQAYYGSTKYAQFLRENNPDISVPDRLAVGTIVRIPPRAEERTPDAAKPSVAEKPAVEKPATDKPTTEKATGAKPSGESAGGRRTYTVKAGDSFYSIAKDVLGDASRWKELYELNKASVNGDPTHLRIGQVVVLPNR
jgi:nucleoid-associated protein YgaU